MNKDTGEIVYKSLMFPGSKIRNDTDLYIQFVYTFDMMKEAIESCAKE
jgi:hypothetical protein